MYYPVVEILSSIAIACVIWFGGDAVCGNIRDERRPRFQLEDAGCLPLGAGPLTLGVLIAFIQYAQRFFRPIMDFSEKYNILQSAMAASERIFKLLDTPVRWFRPL